MDVLAQARERWKHASEFEAENRERARDDLWFRDGEQWPEDVKEERNRDGRPCLTINRVPAFVRQVVNDIRQIRPSIKIRGVDSQSDPETAEVINGMIRAIEAESSAESAYDWAAEYAVTSGVGYWRIVTDYEDERSFDQCIRIERVRNPFSIYIDPAAQAQDASDMRYAFVVEKMPKSEFERKYPDVRMADWDSQDAERDWWWDEDHVRVAEYWEVVEDETYINLVVDQVTGQEVIVEGEELPEAIMSRKTSTRRVIQRLMTGAEILEENEYPGKYIPIVRVLGRELDIEGEVRVKGIVRDLRDPQQQYNYFRSASVERVALYSKAPYIGPKGAFKNPKWRSANKKNYAYLEYDGDIPPSREPPPDISPGFANEVHVAAEELRAVSGIHDPALGARSNEVSGVAIDARKVESDISNFDFVDNLAKAMTYSGKILVDLIPKIYTGPRMLRILKPGGGDEQVMLNQPYVDPQTQRERNFDLQAGKYDVVVDIGPSYTTQRKEAAESMIEVLKIAPQWSDLMGDLLAKSFDWPEADEVAKRLRAMVPPQVIQGENPQIAAILAQKDQEMQMVQQQLQALAQQNQQLFQELQNKQAEIQNKARETAIKEQEIRRKIAKDLMDFQIDATDLEIQAEKDLWPQGQYL